VDVDGVDLMYVKSFTYLDSQNIPKTIGPHPEFHTDPTKQSLLRQEDHGVVLFDSHGTREALIPWSRILEVVYK
jgi:hypothetical protein